ncbi:unnamed protein product, partial [Mesorhabditis spiculigera]
MGNEWKMYFMKKSCGLHWPRIEYKPVMGNASRCTAPVIHIFTLIPGSTDELSRHLNYAQIDSPLPEPHRPLRRRSAAM